MSPSTTILPGLQALRAVAALMVVLHHAELNLLLGFGYGVAERLIVGAAGVDVFFVISGFIMLVSSRRLFGTAAGARTFMVRRLIRIVPLYWAVTTLYVVVALAIPAALARPSSGGLILASYLFWPAAAPDGSVAPIVVVGWTLNYEMFFYALFGLAVLLPRRRAIAAVIAALIVIAMAGALLRPGSTALAFWSNPIILEFAAGILLGVVYESGRRLSRPAAFALGAAGAAGFLIQIGQPFLGGWMRLVGCGLPALALVAAVTLASDDGRGVWLRGLAAIGDASYSLYLTHLLALWACRMIATKLGLVPSGLADGIVFMLVSIGASIGVAFAGYALFERPVTQWLRGRFEQRRDPSAASGAARRA
ncbi:acyltransferase family protein [Enterovirga rhinocerotis]|uniref:acyltransferase family protein n=1 Tax=Enterovirga rhinocerotis TaxID=1339210 RepID=UPI0014150A6C|nr:acyltransferase [Enterovirga rhinocerotis]